jgi:hypothetical protein
MTSHRLTHDIAWGGGIRCWKVLETETTLCVTEGIKFRPCLDFLLIILFIPVAFKYKGCMTAGAQSFVVLHPIYLCTQNSNFDVKFLFHDTCIHNLFVVNFDNSGSGAHPASYQMGTGGSFPENDAAGV